MIQNYHTFNVPVSVGGATNASSLLTLNSTTQGFLIPRMTTAQRDAIPTPAVGLQIYNTETNTINIYNGTWVALSGGGGIGGTIAAGQVAFGSASNTLAGSNNLFWDNTNGRLGVGTNAPTQRLTVQGTTATDGAQLGANILTQGGWSGFGVNWTTTDTISFTHVTGNTGTLTNSAAAINAQLYQITWTVVGRTAGTFTIAFGGYTSGNLSASGNIGPGATSTASLVVTPTTDFNGTVTITIQTISPSSPIVVYNNSAGGISREMRITTSNTNLLDGVNAGQNITTGLNNIAQGFQAGFSNTTGGGWIAQGFRAGFSNTTGNSWIAHGFRAAVNNTTGGGWIAQGYQAGVNNTIGSSWVAQGNSAGLNNTTGSNWIAHGVNAAFNNTTGSNWIAQGLNAGRRWSDGTETNPNAVPPIPAPNFTNSVYIGAETRVGGTSGTRDNENVFGYFAIGNGDNTVTLGNSSVVRHYLSGANPIVFNTSVGSLLGRSTTNSTFSFLTQNSSATNTFSVGDAGLVTIYKDTESSATQSSARIAVESGDANTNLVLSPKGTGAFILGPAPDGTVTGGNARGSNAVDLQVVRGSSVQVAQGIFSSILGGSGHRTDGDYSSIAGGNGNRTVSTYAFVGGGNSNNALSTGSSVLGGQSNSASGNYSAVLGGIQAATALHGQNANSSGRFIVNGDNQTSNIRLRNVVSNATTELFLDGISARAILTPPSGNTSRVWNATAQCVAVVVTQGAGSITAGSVLSNTYELTIKRIGSTTTLVGSPVRTQHSHDGGMNNGDFIISADTDNNALKIEYQPPSGVAADTVIRAVATIYLTELGY